MLQILNMNVKLVRINKWGKTVLGVSVGVTFPTVDSRGRICFSIEKAMSDWVKPPVWERTPLSAMAFSCKNRSRGRRKSNPSITMS